MKTLTIKEADSKTGEETTLGHTPINDTSDIIDTKSIIESLAEKVKQENILMITLDIFDNEKRLVSAVIKNSDFDDKTVRRMLDEMVYTLANELIK